MTTLSQQGVVLHKKLLYTLKSLPFLPLYKVLYRNKALFSSPEALLKVYLQVAAVKHLFF